jgi:hypothetical protein
MSLPCGESNHGRATGNLVTVTIRLNLLLFSIKLVPQLHSAVNERKEKIVIAIEKYSLRTQSKHSPDMQIVVYKDGRSKCAGSLLIQRKT